MFQSGGGTFSFQTVAQYGPLRGSAIRENVAVFLLSGRSFCPAPHLLARTAPLRGVSKKLNWDEWRGRSFASSELTLLRLSVASEAGRIAPLTPRPLAINRSSILV